MDKKQYKFENLEKKYDGFRVPAIKVKINGKVLTKSHPFITEIDVDLGIGYEASACTFFVRHIYDKVNRKFNSEMMKKYFKLGNIVEIELGYIKAISVFKGYISSIHTNFTGGEAPYLEIQCMDGKGIMMNNMRSEKKSYKKYSDAAKNVLGKYSKLVKKSKIDPTPKLERTIEQFRESDYDFVVKLAKEINYEFFILRGTAYFRKPRAIKTPIIQLEWDKNLINFSREIGLAEQISEVTVKNYNEKEKKVIKGTANKIIKAGKGKKTAKKTSSLINETTKIVIIDSSIKTEIEAKKRAEAELDKISMKFVTVRGECIGLPEIIPGRYIRLSKLSPEINNDYYILKVNHRVDASGFITSFEAGVNMI
ncbi:phage late control D family protein [Crassaminicella profunda]|uniref:phage late control D family protein n=1 Tax=Crassaminicella profunda TaxID=1286698 RepID=UPI001CA754FE|nr:hypothetical protein [Crassaminicella profunda]QZY54473.1 hypothetical protein K7H06_15725 [Crassaminicella profunda]